MRIKQTCNIAVTGIIMTNNSGHSQLVTNYVPNYWSTGIYLLKITVQCDIMINYIREKFIIGRLYEKKDN